MTLSFMNGIIKLCAFVWLYPSLYELYETKIIQEFNEHFLSGYSMPRTPVGAGNTLENNSKYSWRQGTRILLGKETGRKQTCMESVEQARRHQFMEENKRKRERIESPQVGTWGEDVSFPLESSGEASPGRWHVWGDTSPKQIYETLYIYLLLRG